jgi:hypothetical protein
MAGRRLRRDDSERDVGRIYRINAATESWWWGVSFMLTRRKNYGTAETREEAMSAFREEYERWQREKQDGAV